jgi:hypothetical protein
MFSTHPPTGDRIESSKKNIEQVLPDKEQYVVTTSEFNSVKMLLAQLQNDRPPEEANKPSLRRRTPRPDVDSDADEKVESTSKETAKETSTKPEDKEPAADDRPTLKRRN